MALDWVKWAQTGSSGVRHVLNKVKAQLSLVQPKNSIWNDWDIAEMPKLATRDITCSNILWVVQIYQLSGSTFLYVLQGVLEDILHSSRKTYTKMYIRKLSAKFQAAWLTGKGDSPMNLQSIKQGVLKDILDSRMESRWLWMSGMTYTNM